MRATISFLAILVLASSAIAQSPAADLDRLRVEGFDAVYNLDYKSARERFLQMTRLAPDHPAGYLYLANNLWLDYLNSTRRLSTSLYTGQSFYQQDKEEDASDIRRDREFGNLIRQAILVAQERLKKNPSDAEALYYQASALGIRAGYYVTVKRSFRRAIGDANESVVLHRKVIKHDPDYVDSYLSIGLYEYVIDSLPWVWRTLARLAGLKGSKKEGIRHLEMVVERGKYAPDDARVVLIGLYSKEGRTDRALEMISQLSARYPRNYLFAIERAGLFYRAGRADEGSRVYGDLLKDAVVAQIATDLVNYQWGESLMAKGDYPSALEKYNAVKQWKQSAPDLVSLAHLHAAQSLDAMGKRAEAVAEYQAVLKRENVFDSHKRANEYVKKPFAPAS
ncbi:MAG: tetratricopeptide repeat protein [Acidobacteriota bacterium]